MKKIFATVLLITTIVWAQPTPHPGWPVRLYPNSNPLLAVNNANCVVSTDSNGEIELILKGGSRIGGFSLSGSLTGYYTNNHTAALSGQLLFLGRSAEGRPRIATQTVLYHYSATNSYACTLLVGDRMGEILTRPIRDQIGKNSSASWQDSASQLGRLYLIGDSIRCIRPDFSTANGFPFAVLGDSNNYMCGMAIGRIAGFDRPIRAYTQANRLHVQLAEDTSDLPNFPISISARIYSAPPILQQTNPGFRVYYQESVPAGPSSMNSVHCVDQSGMQVYSWNLPNEWNSFTLSLIDMEGDGSPELCVPGSRKYPWIFRSNGNIFALPDSLPSRMWGTLGNIVGYRPPNDSTWWFYTTQNDTSDWIVGMCGTRLLPGFPHPFRGDQRAGDNGLTLIPPYQDTLRIVLGYYSSNFMVWDLPCPSGGVVECETARQDFQRTGFYRPYTIPRSDVKNELRGWLPSSESLDIFPNPTNAAFTVQFSNNLPRKINLYTMTGRLAGEWNTGANKQYSFSVPTLASGTYILRTNTGQTKAVTLLR